MNKVLVLLLILVFFLSCSNELKEKTIKPVEDKPKVHEDLISCTISLEMEMSELDELPEADYQRLTDEKNFHSETDSIIYKQDTIFISYLTYVGLCTPYQGNIRISEDTIFLAPDVLDGEECESLAIKRFVYQIHNPSNKNYTIVKF